MKQVVFSRELLERAIATDAESAAAREKGELGLISQEDIKVLFSRYNGHVYILDIMEDK